MTINIKFEMRSKCTPSFIWESGAMLEDINDIINNIIIFLCSFTQLVYTE